MRQDIPVVQQIIQTNHATFEMTRYYTKGSEVPYIVLIGVPGEQELYDVIKFLKKSEIFHAEFVDNDFDFKMAAVVTVPLDEDKQVLLKHYPLWKP